jgi:hypothetical protein
MYLNGLLSIKDSSLAQERSSSSGRAWSNSPKKETFELQQKAVHQIRLPARQSNSNNWQKIIVLQVSIG